MRLVAFALIGDAAIGECRDLRLDLDHARIIRNRASKVLAFQEQVCASEQRLDVPGIEFQRAIEMLDRAQLSARRRIDLPAAGMSARTPWLQRDRLIAVGDRVCIGLAGDVHRGAAGERHGIVGIEPDRLAIGRDRAVMVLGLREDAPARRERRGVAGIDFQRPLDVGERPLGVVLVGIGGRAVDQGHPIVGIAL